MKRLVVMGLIVSMLCMCGASVVAFAASSDFIDIQPGEYYFFDSGGNALTVVGETISMLKCEKTQNQVWVITKAANGGYVAKNKATGNLLAPAMIVKTYRLMRVPETSVTFNLKGGKIYFMGSKAQLKASSSGISLSENGTVFTLTKVPTGKQVLSDATVKAIGSQVGNQKKAGDDLHCGAFALCFLRRTVNNDNNASWKNSMNKDTGNAVWAKYGFKSEKMNISKVKDLLNNNKVVILRCTGRYSSGHYVVAYGYTANGDFLIWDPYSGMYGATNSKDLKKYAYKFADNLQVVYKK